MSDFDQRLETSENARDILPDVILPPEQLPDRAIDDPPPTEGERAPTEPPPAMAAPEEPPQEILPPANLPTHEQAQAELVEIWRTLGQLGIAFTDLSSRIAKLEKFLGFV